MKNALQLALIAAGLVSTPPAHAGGGGAASAPGYLAPLADYGCNGGCIVREIQMHRRAINAHHHAPPRGDRLSAVSPR